MAIEVGDPAEVAGVRFTIYFAKSYDLINWEMLDDNHVYSKKMYTACPAIRYFDGYFYIVYLERFECNDSPWKVKYLPCVVRSKNLIEFERSEKLFLEISYKDFILYSDIAKRKMSKTINTMININNSDIDFCDYNGRAYITYSWGSQHGQEHLALAECDVNIEEMLKSFFFREIVTVKDSPRFANLMMSRLKAKIR